MKVSASILSIAMASCATGALAQTAETQTAAERAGDQGIEEIVVTAQTRCSHCHSSQRQ